MADEEKPEPTLKPVKKYKGKKRGPKPKHPPMPPLKAFLKPQKILPAPPPIYVHDGKPTTGLEYLVQTNPRLALKLINRGLAERSLAEFIKQYWHVVEPATPLVWGWVLDGLCAHLEAVTSGEIKRLILNVPPGFAKSLVTSVFWPAWEWAIGKRSTRYLCVSYSQRLTIRDNRRFLRLISSKDYQSNWPIELDQENVINISNKDTGWKLAGSIGSAITGERGDRIVIDDANNVAESESEQILESTNIWLKEVMPDRLNNLQEGAIVNIQQRTAERDATGTLLDADLGYVHFVVPMEYDSSRHCTTVIGWSDPREQEGELAFPERFPREVVENMKKSKGPYAFAGQYSQLPSPRGGGIIKREWWNLWPPADWVMEEGAPLRYPEMDFILASADTAYTSKEENDPSALVILGLFRQHGMPRVMLMEAWQKHLEFHDLLAEIIKTCKKRKVDALLVEGKASGKSILQEIRRTLSGEEFTLHEANPDSDKVARTHAVVPIFSNKCVFAPDKEWADVAINQVSAFPKAKHDDIHDAIMQGIGYLRKTGMLALPEEAQYNLEQSVLYENNNMGNDPLYDV